ncbi:acetyl-CoA carboxylase carboxyltransferase subunit alpha [Hankyongella ginsenosidimutans]|uniref:Acetyl-coenzyme A carboxylase carboxyl transferase subunit alpha n=1 Tax=Hankyongella ginsenosidimutans TaxID=1763828 RepID=A0A4D7CB62_9SPHN|nr:acetyl-CoA carboxylase carboxyltransferase subunit alpha [Hankyongella ginsenosidimutans]QCI79016.1 acetyl-CoA carboxylase carboxyltransferase subunit alpha [Hankyongella ginsenosidimutans]
MVTYLDFERPIADLESKIAELKSHANPDLDISQEVARLELKAQRQLKAVYDRLTPWQKTLVARHPGRPRFTDIVSRIIDDFSPMAGDRCFGEDQAIIGGFGRLRGRTVMVIGHEKGSDTQSRIRHNFGMAKPEGYRKAVRLMKLADQFGIPVVTLVDTPGAFPGVQAEERGQAQAIAVSTATCLDLKVPLIATVVGEGGSGGAIALAAANTVFMYEHAVYSVISPEGCASILWRTADKAADAAEAMRLTAQDLLQFKVIDRIIEEPLGGAHRQPTVAVNALADALQHELDRLTQETPQALQRGRREKFLAMGAL